MSESLLDELRRIVIKKYPTGAFPEVPWVSERPPWFRSLQQAFVDADLCRWNGQLHPAPQEYAMVALAFFVELATKDSES